MILKSKIEYKFLPAVLLEEVDTKKVILQNKGVYFLLHSLNKPNIKKFHITSSSIIYIGKSINDSIFSRVRKHIASIRNDLYSNGKPKTRPGKKFITYRESIGGDISNHWVIPCLVANAKGYEISYLEEYFLYIFDQKNKRSPLANTLNHSIKI